MFKFALVMMLVGLAAAASDELRWDRIPEAANSSQCIYRSEEHLFTCRGGLNFSIVECPAFLESDAYGSRRIDVFGIERLPVSESPVETLRFNLYPRDMDNVTFQNRSILFESRQVDLSLFFGAEKSAEFAGIRISDVKCWSRLVDLFRLSRVDHTVQVGEVRVSLLGEILVTDKPHQKRWLGWGLPWLGGWGWGLGWGFPLWGLGLWGR
jgi:hypothetical protein